ncbi:hypothetical protein Tco_0791050 [Tanacetum coccineum]
MRKFVNSKNLVYMPTLPSEKSTMDQPIPDEGPLGTMINCPIYTMSSTTVPRWMLPRVLHLPFGRLGIEGKVKQFGANLSHHLAVFAVSWFMGPVFTLWGPTYGFDGSEYWKDSDIYSLANVTAVPTTTTSPRLGGHDDV